MNQDSLSITLTQIGYLVTNLNKKNFAQNSRQIHQLVKEFGFEADRHFLRCLFSAIGFGDANQVSKNALQAKLLSTELTTLLNKPAFVSIICFAYDYSFELLQKNFKPSQNLLTQLGKALNLSLIKEVVIAYALQHSSNSELAKYAGQHLKTCLPKLIQSHIEVDPTRPNQEGSLNDTSPELLQILLSLLAHGKHSKLGLSDAVYEKFLGHLCGDFPRDRVPLILAPLLYGEEETELSVDQVMSTGAQGILSSAIMDTPWTNLIMDIGYAFTASVDDCKGHLVKVGGRDIQSSDVAKIIGLMSRTHTSLSDSSINLPTPSNFWSNSGISGENKEKGQNGGNGGENVTWKPEVFIQALKEVAPNLSWKEICFALDHPEFIIKDRQGLALLITTIRLGCQAWGNGQNFPAECLYRHWENVKGQLSLIRQIIANPEIISFADHIFSSVSIEPLKTPPELDNKDIAIWKSLHLVEVLLYIADNNFNSEVMEIFKFPMQHCPDLLFFALLQIKPPISNLRESLFSNLVPTFLGNHPNSATVLQHAWNSNFPTLKHIIMLSMSDWYLRGDNDQSRLSRILDVAQDLKALSSLLNSRSFIFVIDLACLASRREYLKLEKWLTDKIREHGEQFIQTIVKFLQRRCPQIMGVKIPEDQIPKAAQLPPETLTTILTCLQAFIGNVSGELNDIIIAMTAQCSLLLNKNRQPPPPNMLRQSSVPPQAQQSIPPQQLRALESQFNNNLTGQIFANQNVDFTSAMSGLNLVGPNSNTYNFNMLPNMVSTPVSPSRMVNAASHSPFSIIANPSLNLAGNRMQPTPTGDKLIPNSQNVFPEISGNISKEIEDEANSYFQRIYNHPPHPTLSIDEVLDMLQRFQDSPNRREREVYQCMLRNLFEEYRFFPQYPEKELQITAQLFGGMVERNLVTTYMALGLALRCVLDALKKPEGSKMYYFGITALDRFKTKLQQYQKYCEHVRGIPHFNEFPPLLIEYVEYGANSQEPPNKQQGQTPAMPPMIPSSTAALYNRSNSVTSNLTTSKPGPSNSTPSQSAIAQSRVKSIANATNIDTLLVATQDREEKIIAPPDTIQDKTAFIFNNLSQLNLQQKCEEVKEIMTKEYWPWMAQYLVLKRASIEVNFHVLYSNFLDALKISEINRLVTKETFRNIRVLLRSDKGIANFSDRSLLKNLGHWLGMLTLGRNRPILQLDIDLKSLLVEAYNKGQQELLYVVPFVAKVLESCAKSKVFKPPNPWTMAIMNVLAELHQEPDLKLNLKFEIEVLCKNFNIDVSDLKPVVYLKDPEKVLSIEFQLSQPKQPQQPQQQQQQQQAKENVTPAPTAPISAPGNSNILMPRHDEMGQQVMNAVSPSQGMEVGGMPTGPPEPRFSYTDINVTNLNCIGQLMTISPNISVFHSHPQLKGVVRTVIEKTITEWLNPVVERSVKIALTTCEQIIRKDFALDIDEMHMRTAAHYMVRNLTAGMAMNTCRDQLSPAIITNIKQAFLPTPNLQPKEAETAALQVATDNMELACAFIQKTAIERAILDIDKRLAPDYELRKHAKMEGRPFLDTSVISYQCDRMPEQIRLSGNITKLQFAVYEEFVKNIPGFLPISPREMGMFFPKANTQEVFQNVPPFPQVAQGPYTPNFMNVDDLVVFYEELGNKIEAFSSVLMPIPALQLQLKNMHTLFEILLNARRTRDTSSGFPVTKSVEFLLEGYINMPDHVDHIKLYRDILLRVMRIFHDPNDFGQITKAIFECREEIRYNLEAIDILISSNFISLPTFDIMLSQSMDNGNNYVAVNFAIKLIRHYLIDDRPNQMISEKDFVNTIDLLTRISLHQSAPEGLVNVIEILRLNQDQSLLPQMPGLMPIRGPEHDDPQLQQKIEFLLKDWITIYHTQASGRDPIKTFGAFVNKLNFHGILKTDDLITKFFQQATKICIQTVYRQMAEQPNAPALAKAKIFQWIDPYVRLIALLVKHSGDSTNPSTKINLLNKVLQIVVEVLIQDQEKHGTAFQQIGYHRIFIMLFLELSAPEPILESMSLNVITAFYHTFHVIRPTVAPGFCYSWLELIAHRAFIGRCLATTSQQKGWPMYSQLLMALFMYLAPFLRNAELAKPVQLMYKGTLRVLLVLLHDFPEFLCDYHFGFCDVIPPNCIQMRNLILSAYPRNMRLPDPFTPNLKVDMLSEINSSPHIFPNYVANITPIQFKQNLDSYLKARAPVTFLSELRGYLQISNEPGSRYNIPLMNALVLYVGTEAIAHIRSKNLAPNMNTIVHSAHMDIFQNLSVDLENEGRYLFLNAIANQLRYPNSHTHYFSCVLLYLFVEANSEAIQEQITRVLLERLIVNRPHPWGLLITFVELIKNPAYKFWNHDFVHCAPEIKKLFESVARSCMVKANSQQLGNFETELQECN